MILLLRLLILSHAECDVHAHTPDRTNSSTNFQLYYFATYKQMLYKLCISSCDIHIQTPAKKSSTNFRLYPFTSAEAFRKPFSGRGHGHGVLWACMGMNIAFHKQRRKRSTNRDYTILYYTILYETILCYLTLRYTTLHYTTIPHTTRKRSLGMGHGGEHRSSGNLIITTERLPRGACIYIYIYIYIYICIEIDR